MHSLSHSGVCQKRIIVTVSLSFYNNVFYTHEKCEKILKIIKNDVY